MATSKQCMNPDRMEHGWRAAAGVLAAAALLCMPAWGQMHKVDQPQNVVRAVAVYEWTGDMAKPTASRLIPVSLFINGKLEDAGVYLAQPVPFALLTGNVYELQKAGTPLGTLDLEFARHLIAPETATTTYDDGWFGYGKFVPPALAKKSTLKGSNVEISLNGLDEDESTPHFSARSAKPGSGGAAKPVGGTAAASADNNPADDPDRPTLHRSPSSPDQTASSGSNPADDPDRPTLRKRSEAPKDEKDQGSVTLVGDSLNDDPNRPILHRGKPEGTLTDADIPKLLGLPGDLDLHQLVAVSDAVDRPPHDFSRAWEGDDERQALLTKMEAAARKLLSAYEAANDETPTPAPPPAVTHSASSRTHKTVAKPAPPPPPEPLLDEELKGYMLSYGGDATFVYHAHTDGLGPMLCFVTLVAQLSTQGEPEIALTNVTDAAHLDRTPRMRLVDAVDADASGRASLLFELRAQNSRQFALYRVIGGQATQTFVTGVTE